jgi:hypothetical protein
MPLHVRGHLMVDVAVVSAKQIGLYGDVVLDFVDHILAVDLWNVMLAFTCRQCGKAVLCSE